MGFADFDAAYESTQAKAGFEEVPDGRYNARVVKCEAKDTQAGNPMLKFELEIIDGECAGRKLFANRVVTSKTLEYLKADLAVLGFRGKLSDLDSPEARMGLCGVAMQVFKKTKGQDDQGRPNVNIYFNKALGGGDPTPF